MEFKESFLKLRVFPILKKYVTFFASEEVVIFFKDSKKIFNLQQTGKLKPS